MELSINNNVREPKFRFEHTKHKLGVRVWGDRRSFHELHELLGECWDCENTDMSRAEACSYIGVISYFSYEVRHAFMGDRLVMSYGKSIKEWTDELLQLFEEEPEHFEVELLVSVRQVAEYGSGSILGVSHHYITHLCLNPSCTRVAFLHRYFMADGGLMTRLMTIGTDGTGLRCLAQGFLSHYDWKDDKTIYIFGRANNSLDALRNNPLLSNPLMVGPMKVAKKVAKFILHRGNGGGKANVGKSFMMVTDTEQPIITPFAQEVISEDGHPMTNPINDDWCINDTYPNKDGIRTLMLYNFVTNQRVDLGTFKRLMDKPDMTLAEKYFTGVDSKILSSISQEELAFTRSGLHCDLHPRWSRNGQQAVFDSIHEGTRQIYVAHVGGLIK